MADHCPFQSDMDFLLRRWAKWLRAGTSGLSSVGHGGAIMEHDYTDAVAEMLDKHIAKLSPLQKRIVITIWYKEFSERRAAEDLHIPRHRFKIAVAIAIGWLSARIGDEIKALPTVENVDHWEKRLTVKARK